MVKFYNFRRVYEVYFVIYELEINIYEIFFFFKILN